MRDSAELMRQAELAILNAPFEAGGWSRAIASIAEATGSSGAQLLGMGGPLLLPLNVCVGDYGRHERHFSNPALHGSCNWRIGTTTTPLAIQHEAHYAAYRAAHDTEDYDDAASDLDILFGCQSALLLDQQQLLGLALLRSRRDGPCSAEVIERFAWLRHHLARSVRAELALDGEAAEMMLGEAGRAQGATLLLDRHGALCALTPAAEPALEDDGPLLLKGLGVHLRDPAEDREFQKALARLLASNPANGAAVHHLRAGRAPDCPGGAWRLLVVRLPNREHGLGFNPHLAVTLKRAAPPAG